ncbi:hypothetical protein [Halomonas sp. 25-S5]|uniref:hypothetical protein n=1 Tax=Halomonas sp. 25-S5 TaxID=2994065 RepID=UPI002468A82C|nr:hypothetical protein [Halomonas sp. 25-S5]
MKIETNVKQSENFIVQMNGDYNMAFDEVEVTGTFAEGTILENATTAVSSTSTEVLGIVAKDTSGTANVRLMVRGNPSSVDYQKLSYGTAVEADINALLADAGIIVVNQ